MAVGSGESFNRQGRVELQRQNQAEFGFAHGPLTSFERVEPRRLRQRAARRKRASAFRSADHTSLFAVASACRDERQPTDLRRRMAAVERSRAEPLAVIAHDVRGALSNIAGLAELLGEESPADARHLAARIVTLAHDVTTMMSELIDAARPPCDDSNPVELSARALIAECAADAEALCHRKGLVFHAELPADECITVDRVKLVRVIQNLLSNAIRYTAAGSVILSAQLTDTTLTILVRDTGIGIPAAEQATAFEAYARLAPAARMAPNGAGLGLASVKQLCAALGADIQLESTPGAGSTFTVTLPRQPTPRPAARDCFSTPAVA